MATIEKFEDLEIWQEARAISKSIIKLAKTTNLERDFKLKDQICASVGSTMDNIAEGFERNGNLEFRQFLSIAKGSIGETRSQVHRVFDWEYIDNKTYDDLINRCLSLSKRISNFISYLNKKEFKGVKFKE